jgi:hypothetical protein
MLRYADGVKVDKDQFEAIVKKLLATPPPEPKPKKARPTKKDRPADQQKAKE